MDPNASTVLAIVDDDLDAARTLADMVETFGCVCELHGCASSLLDALSKVKYNAIFLDLSMPGMDGFELIQHFAATQMKVPLLLMSGHSTSVLMAAQAIAFQSGVPTLGMLPKPIRLADIVLFFTGYPASPVRHLDSA
jgi:FixJ family two-component response regulator